MKLLALGGIRIGNGVIVEVLARRFSAILCFLLYSMILALGLRHQSSGNGSVYKIILRYMP